VRGAFELSVALGSLLAPNAMLHLRANALTGSGAVVGGEPTNFNVALGDLLAPTP
jgi:hypothetical protein